MIEIVKEGDKYFRVYTYISKWKKEECDENGKQLKPRKKHILTKTRSDKGKARAKKYKERNDIGKKHNVIKQRCDIGKKHNITKIRKDKGKPRFTYGGKLTKKCMPTVINSEMKFENLYPQIILSS